MEINDTVLNRSNSSREAYGENMPHLFLQLLSSNVDRKNGTYR